MSSLSGQVALITGGARGQGRSHALALAREGADIVVCDLAEQMDTVPYAMGTNEDLQETVAMVEELDRRCIAVKADVRSPQQLAATVERAMDEFGRIDICLANAGIWNFAPMVEMTDKMWQDMIDVDLTGVFNTMRAVAPIMIAQKYGRIVATSSMAGRLGFANMGHYVAAKWGVIGLVKTIAQELAGDGITVNAVAPTAVDTPMIHHEVWYRLGVPHLEHPTREDAAEAFAALNAIPEVAWVQPSDVSAAIMYLVSAGARYITGETIHVAAGFNARNSA